MSKDEDYFAELKSLQISLVGWQQKAKAKGERVVIIFEGRDAAGKDGAIKRIVEHLSVRSTRVAALAKPTDLEQTQWYFQRYAHYLPGAGELVIFNRSWYNRAGVEKVMGFSTPEQQEQFLRDAPVFESLLTASGIRLIKLWLDVSKAEQAKRLKTRATDPLKVLKTSPLDAVAQKRWADYSAARDEMLLRTNAPVPWVCVTSDHKKSARINIMRHLVHELGSRKAAKATAAPDPDVLVPFSPEALAEGRLAS